MFPERIQRGSGVRGCKGSGQGARNGRSHGEFGPGSILLFEIRRSVPSNLGTEGLLNLRLSECRSHLKENEDPTSQRFRGKIPSRRPAPHRGARGGSPRQPGMVRYFRVLALTGIAALEGLWAVPSQPPGTDPGLFHPLGKTGGSPDSGKAGLSRAWSRLVLPDPGKASPSQGSVTE